jgi:hypothetical protein
LQQLKCRRRRERKIRRKKKNMGGGDGDKNVKLLGIIVMNSKFIRTYPKPIKFGRLESSQNPKEARD